MRQFNFPRDGKWDGRAQRLFPFFIHQKSSCNLQDCFEFQFTSFLSQTPFPRSEPAPLAGAGHHHAGCEEGVHRRGDEGCCLHNNAQLTISMWSNCNLFLILRSVSNATSARLTSALLEILQGGCSRITWSQVQVDIKYIFESSTRNWFQVQIKV